MKRPAAGREIAGHPADFFSPATASRTASRAYYLYFKTFLVFFKSRAALFKKTFLNIEEKLYTKKEWEHNISTKEGIFKELYNKPVSKPGRFQGRIPEKAVKLKNQAGPFSRLNASYVVA
jgi:hypothetical protein